MIRLIGSKELETLHEQAALGKLYRADNERLSNELLQVQIRMKNFHYFMDSQIGKLQQLLGEKDVEIDRLTTIAKMLSTENVGEK